MRGWLPVMIVVLLIAAAGSAFSGEAENDRIVPGEWDWEPEALNTYSGTIDLKDFSGEDTTLCLQAVFEPADPSASDIFPRFTSVDGRRITMLEQSDTIHCTPQEGQTAIRFEGSLKMPEKGHYRNIRIVLSASCQDGARQKQITGDISAGSGETNNTGRVFYIPFRIGTVTIVLSSAALVIWLLAVILNRTYQKKHRMGE